MTEGACRVRYRQHALIPYDQSPAESIRAYSEHLGVNFSHINRYLRAIYIRARHVERGLATRQSPDELYCENGLENVQVVRVSESVTFILS